MIRQFFATPKRYAVTYFILFFNLPRWLFALGRFLLISSHYITFAIFKFSFYKHTAVLTFSFQCLSH